jgi:hypothetical protein
MFGTGEGQFMLVLKREKEQANATTPS